jgi:site-specific recombinase XerD
MHERLVRRWARSAYRRSRYKKRIDERAADLLDRGYTPETVAHYIREWLIFLHLYEKRGFTLPTNVRAPAVAAYLERCYAARKVRNHLGAAIRLLLGDADLRRAPVARQPTTKLFDRHVPRYISFARRHRGWRTSRSVEVALRQFFQWLGERRIWRIEAIGPSIVREYIASRRDLSRSTLAGHASALRGFFRYLGMRGAVPVSLAMLVESPRRYRISQPPSVLDAVTIERLLECTERSTPIEKRNFAILLMAARYGLRPSDIRSLRLDDIRWREHRIAIVQSKTQRPLELPLLADVADALVDYLRHGRPTCRARQIFVRARAPHQALGADTNLWGVMETAFQRAGIAPPAGPRGLQLLRHSAATRMLGEGVPFDTISDVLGHSSVEATRIYAQVDLQGLRSVALPARELRS